MKRIVLSLLPVLFLTACGLFGPAPCSEQAAEYIPALESYFDDWDDTTAIANSTPRASLSTVIADLQSIKRDVADLEHPACADHVHQLGVDYMDKTIDGFLSFLSQDEDKVVNQTFDEASTLLSEFVDELAKLKAGEAPYE